MLIKFKVLEVQPANGGCVVQFYTDAIQDHPGARYFVSVYGDPPPTGEDLRDYIMSYAPRAWLIQQTKLLTIGPPPGLVSALNALVGVEVARGIDDKGMFVPVGPAMLVPYEESKGF